MNRGTFPLANHRQARAFVKRLRELTDVEWARLKRETDCFIVTWMCHCDPDSRYQKRINPERGRT